MSGTARLFTYADPLELPHLPPTALTSGDADGVVLDATDAARVGWRYPPLFIDDPSATRLFAGFAESGIANPPAFTASYRNAWLVGHRTILTSAGACLLDEALLPAARPGFIAALADSAEFSPSQTPLRPAGSAGQFVLPAPPPAPRRLEGPVAVLSSAEPVNFGSFLFRVLPKLHQLRRHGLERLPLLLHVAGPNQLQFLTLLGVHPGMLVAQELGRCYALDHAIVPCQRNGQAFLDAATRAVFAGLRNRFGPSGSGGNRIYVSRLGFARTSSSNRVMLNEAALITRLTAMGFQIVEPETLSAPQQVSVFAGARLVVGASGSGMFNVVFCRPGTRVIDIESDPGCLHAHTCLFASLELRYGLFLGRIDPTDPSPAHQRWSVDIEALCARIAAFDGDIADPPAYRRPAVLATRSGTLDHAGATEASGWAQDGSDTPAEVEILVDGVVAGRVRADQPRGDLHAHGPCAFALRFAPALPPGAVVIARFADTATPLVHSPRLV